MPTRIAPIALVIASCFHASAARSENELAKHAATTDATQLPFEIQMDSQASGSVLRISRSALKAAGYELRAIDAPQTGDWSPSRTRSIVAASAMSLGFAGVFLLRGKRRTTIATGVVAAILVGAIGMQAWGNGAPGPRYYKPQLLIVPLRTPESKAGAEFNGNTFIRSGSIDAGDSTPNFNPSWFGPSAAQQSWFGPTYDVSRRPANPAAHPLTMPPSTTSGAAGFDSNLTNLIEMKPGPGAVTLENKPRPLQGVFAHQQSYHGNVAIDLTDDDIGLRLVIGTNSTQPNAQVEARGAAGGR